MAEFKGIIFGNRKVEVCDTNGRKMIGDAFSTEKVYAPGDFCIYDNALYLFVSDKDAGEWDPAAVQSTNVLDELRRQNATISRLIDWAKTVDADLPYSARVEPEGEGENHFKFLTSMRAFYEEPMEGTAAKAGDV